MNKSEYPLSLNLPKGDPSLLTSAAEAVRQEYRNSVRWKRLRCRKVSRLTGQDEGIFVVEVGHAIDLDWTWEGAIAFRPIDVKNFQDDLDQVDNLLFFEENQRAGELAQSMWSGEVVEIDETNGKVFVYISDPEHPPRVGTFFIRPYDFLFHLNNDFNNENFGDIRNKLSDRLNACQGGVHPKTVHLPGCCLESLKELWSHSWEFLWGPPGTGKTTTIGKQVSACISEDFERILVVSTTNRATDEVALAIGLAVKSGNSQLLSEGKILRIGKSAGYARYKGKNLLELLQGTETDLLYQVSVLQLRLQGLENPEERAVLRKQIQDLLKKMKSSSLDHFISPRVKVVVATVFKAITLLNDQIIRDLLSRNLSCFSTVIIDEAGLISRAAGAVLSLLGSHRVVFVGDPKQLAPISRVSRILPTNQAIWLGSSTLDHLQTTRNLSGGVYLLKEQYRMNPEISQAISQYQYEGSLKDSLKVLNRWRALPPLINNQRRAIWYVLDEEDDLPLIRAERGPGKRSWVRPITRKILKKFFSDKELWDTPGIFVSPFRAQAKDIGQFFNEEGLKKWTAATIHSFQGTEAEIVILDTVNAGSCGWSTPEWKRLINVGLSRGKEFAMVLASRAEMNQVYLKPLVPYLKPKFLREKGGTIFFDDAKAEVDWDKFQESMGDPSLLGSQLVQRKSLRPVLSREQQRLCGLKMDGKPRLVRGVAGSGKTYVLAHWLGKTIKAMSSNPEAKFLAVYANASLKQLIEDTIASAWENENNGLPFPWEKITFFHIKEILELKLPEVGLPFGSNDFEYDDAAAKYLAKKKPEEIQPICHAMFIDEAQDMGPNTLKLLACLVKRTDPSDPNSKSVNIFYDNAQNIYGRATPKWSEMGLDMRGRSTVMEESFRSTKPISEFALNVLYSLQPPESDPDYKELIKRGLIEKTIRYGAPWWEVRFNQIDGPLPLLRKFSDIDAEIDSLGDQLVSWICEEGVRPRDVCILYIGPNIARIIDQQISAKLNSIGVCVSHQTSRGFERDEKTILVTTPHSFKGFEAEIVVVAGVDQFTAKEKGILSHTLYVAMTRARSILAIYGKQSNKSEIKNLFSVFDRTLDLLLRRSPVQVELSPIDDFEDLASKIGKENRSWLEELCHSVQIQQEPIIAADGEIVAEPLFWFKSGNQVVACFEKDSLTIHFQHRIEDFGGKIIFPGDKVGLTNIGAKRDDDIYPGLKPDVPISPTKQSSSNNPLTTKKTAGLSLNPHRSQPFFVVKRCKDNPDWWQVVNTKTGEIIATISNKESAEKRASDLNGENQSPREKVFVVKECLGGWKVVNATNGEVVFSTNIQQTALNRARELNGS